MKSGIIYFLAVSILSQNLMAQEGQSVQLATPDQAIQTEEEAKTQAFQEGSPIEQILAMEIEDLKKFESGLDPEIRKEIIADDLVRIELFKAQIDERLNTNGKIALEIQQDTMATLLMTSGSAILASPFITIVVMMRYSHSADYITKKLNGVDNSSSRLTEEKTNLLKAKLAYIEAKRTRLRSFAFTVDDIASKAAKKILPDGRVGAIIYGIGAGASILATITTIVIPGKNLVAPALAIVLNNRDIGKLQESVEKSQARLELLQADLNSKSLESEAAEVK